MNRFRSRKKSNGETSREGSRRPSLDTDVPAVPSFSSRTFKRKKNAAPEPKPQIDLSAALPSSDDFRTSLLMPKLSARFSMLKEQDDPTSKIGKANDDSVLFPKRASRLDLFNGRPGLSDIAEVGSLPASIRPPFASSRTESFGSDGYNTDDGSVMSRARPGEGNTMFGGRQKIYKIPVGGAGSVKNFSGQDEGEVSSGGNMGGKPIYESDITLSTFQKLREQEREENEQAPHELGNMRSSKEQDRSGSPPYIKYNRNRETSSSTTSAPSQSRMSTAATSVASQKSIYGVLEHKEGLSHGSLQPSLSTSDRPWVKSRRLYGQGLDRDIHEQQSSALQKLGSFNRSRTPVGGPTISPLHQSRSASNLNDRYRPGGPLSTSNSFRAGSPQPSSTPPSRMADFDLCLNDDPHAINPTDSGYGRSPPLSPPLSPDLDSHNPDPTLLASLEPNDIGKATASGAFNKPKKQYNEQQYLQRQLQLQEGRNTPSPQLMRPYSPQLASFDEQATAGRSRNNSQGTTISRSGSFRRPWMEDRIPRALPESEMSPALRNNSEEQNQITMERSFLSGLKNGDVSSGPESESEADVNPPGQSNSRSQSIAHSELTRPVEIQRPLNLNPQPNHTVEPINDAVSESQSFKSEATITQLQGPQPLIHEGQKAMNADSPTLGPAGVPNGLSGLVRAHLRNDSGQSSIYLEGSPSRSRKPEARESIFGHESALDQHYSNSQSRAAEQHDRSMAQPLSLAARHMLERATALKNQQVSGKTKQMLGNDKAQRILGEEVPRTHHETQPPWREQLGTYHARDASTETQKEREELASELAHRRRIVQDKLQTFVEMEGSSASPALSNRTQESSPGKSSNAFGLLKKSSRGSFIERQEKPSKAMKMLGIEVDSSSHQPPPDLFVGRAQYQDRAMPPRPKGSMRLMREDNPSPEMNEALSLEHREARGLRDQEDGRKQHSPRSSKTSSAYSEPSEVRSGSRKGSTAKPSTDGHRVNGFGPFSAADSSEMSNVHETSKNTDQVLAGLARQGFATTERSQSAQSGRLRSNSKTSSSAPFEQRAALSGTPFMINPSNKRPEATSKGASSHSTSSLREHPPFNPVNRPTMINPSHSPTKNHSRPRQGRQQSINKHDISEPTFISCTSSVDTIDLPPGANLMNGMDTPPSPGVPPPIPARDARRKRTQTLLQALGRLDKPEPLPSTPSSSPSQTTRDEAEEEQSTFSADEEPPSKWRQRLRKTSSEGVNMHAKARQQASRAPSPAMPQSPHAQTTQAAIGHVPYQAQRDVPASAVMF
ncbi:MAG: hypothetical protein Q9217_002355 [Psora testacea]